MNQQEILEKHYEDLDNRERLEHQDVLLSIGVLLKSPEGLKLFKYLFKSLEVTCVPEQGLEPNALHEYLGFLRAGNSIYKLVCEADPEIAGSILSRLERDRYERLHEEYRLEADSRTDDE